MCETDINKYRPVSFKSSSALLGRWWSIWASEAFQKTDLAYKIATFRSSWWWEMNRTCSPTSPRIELHPLGNSLSCHPLWWPHGRWHPNQPLHGCWWSSARTTCIPMALAGHTSHDSDTAPLLRHASRSLRTSHPAGTRKWFWSRRRWGDSTHFHKHLDQRSKAKWYHVPHHKCDPQKR